MADLVAALGLAHWFFGNLYEAIVIAPNWLQDSPATPLVWLVAVGVAGVYLFAAFRALDRVR